MTTTGTWYPPSLGTGGFLADGQMFTNPPFAEMTDTDHDPTGRGRVNLAAIVALRATVSDRAILNWLELLVLLPEGNGTLETAALRERWNISQPALSRRMSDLFSAGLINYRSGGGRYRVRWIQGVEP